MRPGSVDVGELPVGIVLLDEQDIVVDANAAFESWAGSATVGLHISDLFAPADDFLDGSEQRAAKLVTRVGDPGIAAMVIRTPRDGGALLTVLDATERYRTGHELRRSLALAARTRTRLELVIEASIAFAEATSEVRLAEILAATTAKAYAAEESVVFLVDDHGELLPAAGSNPFADLIDTRAYSARALALSQVLKVSGVEEGDAIGLTLGAAMRETGVQALIAAPVRHDDESFGVFVCFFHHPRQFDDEASPLADALAGQAAQTLTSLRLQRQLQHAALHDETTGLPNRRLLEQHSAIDGGRRRGVVFVDLDGFKMVNDQFGHDRGDELLAEVGRRLMASVRDGDTVVRFGGDEFVMICDDVDRHEAIEIAERIRVALRGTYDFQPIPITASVGVSVADDDTAPIDALIRAADLAMYRAKAEGGDRVVLGNHRFY